MHSLGSLAGAAVGSFYLRQGQLPTEKATPEKLRDDELDGPAWEVPDRSSVRSIYWLVTLGVFVLASLVAIVMNGSNNFGAAVVFIALFVPALQLGGSLICSMILVGTPSLVRDVNAWKRLGWITLGTVVGCLSGLLIMYLVVVVSR